MKSLNNVRLWFDSVEDRTYDGGGCPKSKAGALKVRQVYFTPTNMNLVETDVIMIPSCLLEFYVLATSNVISDWVRTCDSV